MKNNSFHLRHFLRTRKPKQYFVRQYRKLVPSQEIQFSDKGNSDGKNKQWFCKS